MELVAYPAGYHQLKRETTLFLGRKILCCSFSSGSSGDPSIANVSRRKGVNLRQKVSETLTFDLRKGRRFQRLRPTLRFPRLSGSSNLIRNSNFKKFQHNAHNTEESNHFCENEMGIVESWPDRDKELEIFLEKNVSWANLTSGKKTKKKSKKRTKKNNCLRRFLTVLKAS